MDLPNQHIRQHLNSLKEQQALCDNIAQSFHYVLSSTGLGLALNKHKTAMIVCIRCIVAISFNGAYFDLYMWTTFQVRIIFAMDLLCLAISSARAMIIKPTIKIYCDK